MTVGMGLYKAIYNWYVAKTKKVCSYCSSSILVDELYLAVKCRYIRRLRCKACAEVHWQILKQQT